MIIKEVIQSYSTKLKSSSPILDIELLLTKTLGKNKEYLYTYPDKRLTTKQLNNFTTYFKRRQKGEPIAYILGYKNFFGLDFKVNKNVLIPRPETEILVEEVIKYFQSPISNIQFPISICDIGTGSGAIIIALAKNSKGQFYATDISTPALNISNYNAKKNKIKIKFLQGNLLEPLTKIHNSEFRIHNSIITANLPYLTTQQLNNPQLKYEPKVALNGGADGLECFREFFNQIKKFKLQPQAIFLEIGHNQATAIKKLAKQTLPHYKFKIKKDLCGFDRIFTIYK